MSMSSIERLVALAIVVMLPVGFTYSGMATVRLHRMWLSSPAETGPDATIDANLASAGIKSAEDLRRAAVNAGWPAGEGVVVVGAASAVSANDLTQFHFSASYLLYPRRVWVTTWCDGAAAGAECERRQATADPSAAVAGRRTRHVLLVSTSNPFPAASVRPLSNLVSLVDLP